MATNLQMLIKIATGADVSGLNKTDSGIKKLGKTAQAVSKQTSMLGALTGKIFGGINFDMIRRGFMNYLQFEKDLGAMKSRFFAITHDEKLASEEFKYISKVAIDTANDIKSVTDSYSIFYASARRSLGQEGARGVFEAWTKIGRVLHLDSEAFGRVTYALREMSSKGQLYSQDLKMQLGTHVPDAVDIASTAIQNLGIAGVDTVEKFQELTKKNPKSGLMAKFLIEFSKEAEKRFASPEALAKALRQPDALAQMIPNMFWQFMTKFSEAGGNEAIVNILTMTFDILNAIPWNNIAKATGTMAKYLSQHLPQILSLLKDIAWSVAIFYGLKGAIGLFKGIFTFFKVFSGFSKGAPLFTKILYSLGRAIPKLGEFLFGQGLKTSSKGVLGAVLGVSGPLGWLFTALMFLPEIVHLCKWIYNKLPGRTSSFGEYLQKQGISSTNFYNAMQKAQEFADKGASEKFTRRILTDYLGKGVAKKVEFNDHGQLVVNFKGNFLTTEDIAEQLNIAIKTDKETGDKKAFVKGGKYTERPSTNKNFSWEDSL